jgi:hypothetical protein
MDDLSEEGCQTGPEARAFGRGPDGLEGTGPQEGEGSGLAASANPSPVHYTPKHASWLNPAEIEVGLWSRECLGRDRVATFAELSRRTRAWNARANSSRRRINWQFTTADARRVFRYEQSVMHGTEH